MTNSDSYFYINWEDAQKNLYRVGVLARLENVYYARIFAQRADKERDAFSHGYIGIPGFKLGKLYRSENQLFDFFANRVYQSGLPGTFDYMEELKKTGGRIFIDSFSLEEIPEKRREECKKYLLMMDGPKDFSKDQEGNEVAD